MKVPFKQAVKLYLKALQSIELTQYKRAKGGEREIIMSRNKKLDRLGFGIPDIKLPLK